MRIKTADLIGPALDWAVAKCEEDAEHLSFSAYNGGLAYFKNQHLYCGEGWFNPSTNWAQGGPIIDRNGIATERKIIEGTTEHEWKAYVPYIHAYGPTPLIAAMRCYVASKLGDEVEVPDALLS